MPEIRDAVAEYKRAYLEKYELLTRLGLTEKAAAIAEVLRGYGVSVGPEPVTDAPAKRGPGRPSTRTLKADETAAE